MLVERHAVGTAKAATKAQIGVQTQGQVFGHREEALTAIIHGVELQITARHGHMPAQALRVATIREYAAIERALRPGGVEEQVGKAVPFGIQEIQNLLHGIDTALDGVLLGTHPEGDARGVTDRITEVEAATEGVDGVAGDIDVQLIVVGSPVECVVAQAHAVNGEVRIQKAEGQRGLIIGAVCPDTYPVTGTEEVVLADRATEDDTGALGKTEAGGYRAGRLLFDAVIDVNQIVGAGYRNRLDIHFLEETQALKAGLGLINQIG